MTTIVALGDLHIPYRADSIPEGLFIALEKIKPDYLALTGDYTSKKVYEDLVQRTKEIVPNVHVLAVRGNMDSFKDLPEEDFVDIVGVGTVGVIHGHQIYPRGDITKLYNYAKKRNRTILIHGHTHMFSVDVVLPNRDVLLVNPGTLTGAWGGLAISPTMTFAEIIIKSGRQFEVHQREFDDPSNEPDIIGTRKIKL